MAVSTTNAISGPYTTNGVTTDFPFTFTAASVDEVQVVLRDSDGNDTIVNDGDYDVTLAGGGGGTVAFATAPATGYSLYVEADPDFTQGTEFEEGGRYLATAHNAALDRAALRDQWLRARVDAIYPEALMGGGGAGQFLAFDGSGNPVLSDGTGSDAGMRTDLASTASGKGGALVGYKGWFTDSQPGDVAKAIHALGRIPLEEFIGYSWSNDNEYSAGLQKAFNELDNYTPGAGTKPSFVAGPTLLLPTGRINLASQVTSKRLITEGHGMASEVYWTGGEVSAILVANTKGGFRKVRFNCATAVRPMTWVDVTGSLDGLAVSDYGLILEEIFYGFARGSALKLPPLTNLTIKDQRWNNCACCIEITGSGSDSDNRHLVVDGNSTIDFSNQAPSDPYAATVEEFFKFHIGANDRYTFTWSAGRMEGHSAQLHNDFALFRTVGNAQQIGGLAVNIEHGGMQVADALAGTQHPAIVYYESTQTNLGTLIQTRDFVFDIPTPIAAAYRASTSVSAFLDNPAIPNNYRMNMALNPGWGSATPEQATILPPRVSLANGRVIGYGTGSPEGSFTGPIGSEWTDTTNGVKYLKTSGTGNTGWQMVSTYNGSKTFDWPSLATATQQSTTVTVTGAAVGDMVLSVSMDQALSGTRLWGEVTASNTVTVYQRNDTGGTVDVPSGTLRAIVKKG